jgi:leucyl-tRNA synthetase
MELYKDFNLKIDKQRYFHVAIARLMEMTNLIQKSEDFDSFSLLVQLLYPFSPHLCSEIWAKLYDG